MSLSKKDKQGILLIIVSSLAIIGLLTLPIFLKKNKHEYDPETFCLQDRNYAHTILLVDKTDPFTEKQIIALKKKSRQLKQQLNQFEKLSIYILDDINYAAPTPIFSMCSPGTGKEANELYQNPTKIQMKFDAFFGKPLDDAIDQLIQVSKAPQSPILEMLAEINLVPDFNKDRARKLIIVSDLLQNMPDYSHYKKEISFSEWLEDKQTSIANSFLNTSIDILYIRRKGNRIQGATHLDFWRQYFINSGAAKATIKQI